MDDFEREHFRALFAHVPTISNANFAISRNQRATPAKSMKTKKGLKPVWIYDGSADQADLAVAATSLTEGGYVIVIELTNGLTRLAATRHPAKYVTSWHQFVKRYGLPEIARLIISQPHLRYEAIKRGIAKALVEQRDEELDVYHVPVAAMTEKAEVVIAALASL
jgi:hypothetical protein